jgi:hypothetical protein
MAKAIVQIGNVTEDYTAGKALHGDVLELVPDEHVFGQADLVGRRVVELPGDLLDWNHLMSGVQHEGCFPLFRHLYLDDDDAVQVREPVRFRIGL